MNWRIALSMLLILCGGALVAWHAVEVFTAVYEGTAQGEDLDDEELAARLVENAERSGRILQFLSGGGALLVGVALAVHEAVRARLARR